MKKEERNILLVDDHHMILEGYKNVLSKIKSEDYDISVETADNCDTAWEILKGKKFDIVFLDINFPIEGNNKILSGEDLGIKIKKELPEVKIIIAHENTTKSVCPMSGWNIKSNETMEIKISDNEYLRKICDLLLQRIVAKIIIKKGFKTSIGWNLGRKNKSIHLLEPLTSIPIIGTKNKEINEIKKRIIEYLYNLSVLKEEKMKIRNIPIKT